MRPPRSGPGTSSYAASDRESLRLELVELRLGDRSVVEQLLGCSDLVGAGAAATGGDHRTHVLGLLLLRLLVCLEGALRHPAAAGDQVHEDAEERQEDDEQAPEGLRAAAHVTATEDIAEDVEHAHDPCEEDEELEHGEQERPVVVEHVSLRCVLMDWSRPDRAPRCPNSGAAASTSTSAPSGSSVAATRPGRRSPRARPNIGPTPPPGPHPRCRASSSPRPSGGRRW